MKNQELTEIFRDVGRRYGFTDVTATFAPLTDLKAEWSRSYVWAEFRISDYLSEISPEAMRDMAIATFEKIANGYRPEYGEDFKKEVFTDAFRERWRPLYIKRAGLKTKIKDPPKMDIPDVLFYRGRRPAEWSIVFRVITLPSRMTDEEKEDLLTRFREAYQEFSERTAPKED